MTAAIIMAAGASSRMGMPKGLVRLGRSTALESMLRNLEALPLEKVYVVIGSAAGEYRAKVPESNFQYVLNAEWSRGRTGTVKAGLRALGRLSGPVILWPVDHPLVSQNTLSRLMEVSEVAKCNWIVPSFRGKRGHPPVAGPKATREIMTYGDDEPLRRYPLEHPSEVVEADVEDRGILENLDTPDELARATTGRPEDL